jgi:ABC-type glycerol-3-phosphate transport system substrate-binding protein
MVGSKDKEHADAAVAFLKHAHSLKYQAMAFEMQGKIPDSRNVVITDELMKKIRLPAELMKQANDAEKRFVDYSSLWYQNVQDALNTLYPDLATGKLTPEQFCQKLTAEAQKNAQ